MPFTVEAHMKDFGEAGYVAWIENPKNFKMVVQGTTPENTTKELLTSLKVTLSYLLGIDINSIEQKEVSDDEFQKDLSNTLKETGKKELKFAFS